ncbi:MAG: response regulator [Myxococcales bacterium]|nr:response regulator [Myxococcales bacterium]
MQAPTKIAEILLVEDNPADVRLTMEVMRESKMRNHVTAVGDGEEALDYLQRRGRHANAVRPDLILLDLNLPRKDGREVLEEIKAIEELRRIPVVVLTTSKAEEDIGRTYDLHANCYITKPMDLDKFINVVRQIEDFWLTTVSLPDRPDSH